MFTLIFQPTLDDNIQLGPGGRNFGGWGRGSTGGGRNTSLLRKNNWVPRRDKSSPKMNEQIHNKAEEEKVQKGTKSERMAAEMSRRRSKGNLEVFALLLLL